MLAYELRYNLLKLYIMYSNFLSSWALSLISHCLLCNEVEGSNNAVCVQKLSGFVRTEKALWKKLVVCLAGIEFATLRFTAHDFPFLQHCHYLCYNDETVVQTDVPIYYYYYYCYYYYYYYYCYYYYY